MPDEDQNIGTSMETTEANQESPELSSAPAEVSPAETPEGGEAVETTETAEPTIKAETVNDALAAFGKEKEQSQQFPSSVKPAEIVRKGRDYSGLSQDEVAIFKKTGDRAFDVLKPMFLEHKKLKADYEALKTQSEQTSKSSFYENEEAYQLSPDYKNYSANAAHLDNEISYWQQQLINIREGNKWAPLVLDEKGNVIVGQEQDPSPRGEATILNGLQQAHALKAKVSDKITEIKSSFGNQHKSYITNLQAVEKKIFEGADQTVLDKAMATKLPLFPSYLHGKPEIRALAKALAVIDGLIIIAQQKEAAGVTAIIKSRTSVSNGPRGGELQPGNGKAGTVGSVFDEFARAKAEGIA